MFATPSRSRQLLLVALALLTILPIASLAAVSIASRLPDFFNPCFTWGMGSGGFLSISTAGPCARAGGTSETIPQAVLTMILIQGVILLAASFGVIGVIQLHRALIVAASVILFLESAPFVFDGLFILTIPPATLLLLVYAKLLPWAKQEPSLEPDEIGRTSPSG